MITQPQPNTRLPIEPNIKIYSAIMNNTGSGPPVMTILHNTIGNIIWTQNSTGDWSGTLNDAFTENTIIFTQIQANAHMAAAKATKDYVSITMTTNDGTPFGEVTDAAIEIRIYKKPQTT